MIKASAQTRTRNAIDRAHEERARAVQAAFDWLIGRTRGR